MSALILFYGVLVSTVATAAVGVVRYRRLVPGARMLAVLCIVAAFQLMLSYVLILFAIRNYEVLNYYKPIELVLLGAIFYSLVESNRVQRVVVTLLALYLIVWIVDLYALDDPTQLNNRMSMLSRMTAIAIAIPALYSGQKSASGPFLQYPLFWVGTAAVLYSAGTLLIVGLSNQLIGAGMNTFISVWQINWVFLIITNFLYIKGLLCKPQCQT
jgi:hypothetical protein